MISLRARLDFARSSDESSGVLFCARSSLPFPDVRSWDFRLAVPKVVSVTLLEAAIYIYIYTHMYIYIYIYVYAYIYIYRERERDRERDS